MGSVLKWLVIVLIVALVGLVFYFGFSEDTVERTVVEQPVDRETLGL
ncbi:MULTISPECIES: hypothetical protein [Pacificimonas]|uniref:Uncharacterized protein n=1 Tax=Pacificimonas aurantium TaxID=1250540 RepID=A0ABS7WHX1_9SPHN|nr:MULTISPECIES: hypothetical protein [Pacificimonas]MBZ6377968.1 hypothetical protein [Pacificimonas aurantium]